MQREGTSTLSSVVLYRNLFACVYANALLLSLGSFDWGDEKRTWFYLFLDSIKYLTLCLRIFNVQ